jgi:hypothetical protein
MVLVAARTTGNQLPRAELTKDGDIVVDVLVQSGVLGRVAEALGDFGYSRPPEASYDTDILTRCSFVMGNSQLDVLGSDEATEDDLVIKDVIRSIAIPGGRRALELAEFVKIEHSYEFPDVEIRVPLIPGAIVVKAIAAVDPRTNSQMRHIQDVAALFAVVDDPEGLRSRIHEQDLDVVKKLKGRLGDDGDVAWTGMSTETRLRGQAAASIVLGD